MSKYQSKENKKKSLFYNSNEITAFAKKFDDLIANNKLNEAEEYIKLKLKENKSLDIDWRVRSDKDGNIKIIDVKIEGISMVATQRDDFTARISSSGVNGLNQYMKNIIDGFKFANTIVTP